MHCNVFMICNIFNISVVKRPNQLSRVGYIEGISFVTARFLKLYNYIELY